MPLVNDADDLRLGDAAVDRLYLGSNLVWERESASPSFPNLPWHSVYWADQIPVADGGAVASWPDLSGNGRDLVQATAAFQPTMRSAVPALGGRRAVEFDGVDDYIRGPAAVLAQPYSVVVVFAGAGASGEMILGRYGGVGDGIIIRPLSASGVRWSMFAGANVNGTIADNGKHLIQATFAGPASSLAVDGIAPVTGDVGGRTMGGVRLGADYNNGGALSGHVAFLGVLNRALTTDERDRILVWSRATYGTP